jgi:hypothetical protein
MVNLTNEHLEKLPKREILRIIYAYNMHVKIKGYRNMSKPDLIHEIMKRVSVDAEGKLTLKDIMVDDENKNVPKSINWVRKPLKGRVKKVKEPEPEPEPKAKATKKPVRKSKLEGAFKEVNMNRKPKAKQEAAQEEVTLDDLERIRNELSIEYQVRKQLNKGKEDKEMRKIQEQINALTNEINNF